MLLFNEQMKGAIWITSFLVTATLIVGLIIRNIDSDKNAEITEITAALQEGRIGEPIMLMRGRHDLKKILVNLPHDQRSLQAALDEQFEYAYVAQEDTNYAYPEDLSSIQALVDAGAKSEFRHLLAAAQQGKMKTVAYFIDRGVPVQESGADETPLSGAA